ncbi:MAG: orotate phosphoribosyltransferase [Asgard group archaeon]|nr:orotate phosphoribosyltransferase [Asgard group archaeon]
MSGNSSKNESCISELDNIQKEENIEVQVLDEFSQIRPSIKIALLAIFTALGVALATMFAYLPFFELMSLTLFIGGAVLGPLYSIFLAILSSSLYEIISTTLLGVGPIIFPFKIIAYILIALTGALIGRRFYKKPTLFWRFFIGVIGGLLTISYDLIVNFGWVLLSVQAGDELAFSFVAYFSALVAGIVITISRTATNILLFIFVPDILNRAILPILGSTKDKRNRFTVLKRCNSMSDDQTKDNIIKTLEKTGALKFGDFTLASGTKSKYYIDLRIIPNFPEEFNILIDEAVSYITKHFPDIEGIVAIPMAAIPFGTLIAHKLNKPYYILRKEPKKHGLKKMIEGEITKGQKILLVDDLVSSGFSKAFAITALREEGATVDDLFVFIDRSKGLADFEKEQSIKVHYLINAKDILDKVKE